jgi:hypothetical protein
MTREREGDPNYLQEIEEIVMVDGWLSGYPATLIPKKVPYYFRMKVTKSNAHVNASSWVFQAYCPIG